MRAWIATLTVLAAGMLLTTGVLADDADDIKALEIDSRAQEMAGNVDGYFQYKGSGYSIFPPTNGFLSPGSTKERAQARFDAGMKFDMQMRNFRRQVLRRHGPSAPITWWEPSRGPAAILPQGGTCG